MKMCINRKAVTALGLVGLAVAALAPDLIGPPYRCWFSPPARCRWS